MFFQSIYIVKWYLLILKPNIFSFVDSSLINLYRQIVFFNTGTRKEIPLERDSCSREQKFLQFYFLISSHYRTDCNSLILEQEKKSQIVSLTIPGFYNFIRNFQKF